MYRLTEKGERYISKVEELYEEGNAGPDEVDKLVILQEVKQTGSLLAAYRDRLIYWGEEAEGPKLSSMDNFLAHYKRKEWLQHIGELVRELKAGGLLEEV